MTISTTRRDAMGVLIGGLGLSLAAKSGAHSLSGKINASRFGVSPSSHDNREAFQNFINYLAQTGTIGTIDRGVYKVEGGLSTPTDGPIRLEGSGKGQTRIKGTGGSFLQPSSDLLVSSLSVIGFDYHIDCKEAGDIHLSNCSFEKGKGFLRGKIKARTFTVTDCTIKDFLSFGILVSKAEVTDQAIFSRNHVRNITRFLYRMSHKAPLFFEGNDIDGITAGRFTGTGGVARVILRGGSTTYIRNNIIKNVIASDAGSNLLYWSGGNAVITGNTFGKFSSSKRTNLVQEKDTSSKHLVLSDNIFLGGKDLGEFDTVVYATASMTKNPSIKIIERNRGEHLQGKLLQILQQKQDKIPPGNFVVRDNNFAKLDAPALVSIIQGAQDIVVAGNIIGNMSNPKGQSITGRAIVKCLVGVSITSDFGIVKRVKTHNNALTFSTDGEAYPKPSSLYYLRIFSGGKPQSGSWTSSADRVSGADNILTLAKVPSGRFFIKDLKIAGLKGAWVTGVPAFLEGL